MTMTFEPATREASYARIALSGPSGSGKTYTALVLATALSDTVAVIDTERGSASKYVGLNGWKFDTVKPQAFSPRSLVELLGTAAGAGYGCVVIDSLSHYWMGVDGMLEQVDKRSRNGNSFTGWKEAGPDERRMIESILAYPGHLIATMRTKTEWVIEENERGKKEPRKVGLKPEQRTGIEYEFDVVGDLDQRNILSVTKTRIPTLSKAVISEPDSTLADTIKVWLSEGVVISTVGEYRDAALAATSEDELREIYKAAHGHRLVSAPCVGGDGSPTVLGDFIKFCAEALKTVGAEQ